MKISLTLPDDTMPRTVYYDQVLQLLRSNKRFVEDPAKADVLFPAEDTAVETNWPRYGNPQSAYSRGFYDNHKLNEYLQKLAQVQARICLISLIPTLRLPQAFRNVGNVVIADSNLSQWERTLNPRTVSMPVLPVTTPTTNQRTKSVTASFRGVDSHPCRQGIAALHDGSKFICELVPQSNHLGKIDATAAKVDQTYAELMDKSVFAFVPRGDAMFSYRLLEALAFNCIPIIVSDSWVLPFDRSVPWSNISLTIPESAVSFTPAILQQFEQPRIEQMIKLGAEVYQQRFGSLAAIVETLLMEVESML